MVEETKDSPVQPAPLVDKAGALPEVPALAAAKTPASVMQEAASPAKARKAKVATAPLPVVPPQAKADVKPEANSPAAVEASAKADATPVRKNAQVPPQVSKARPVQPRVAAAPVPAVKPALPHSSADQSRMNQTSAAAQTPIMTPAPAETPVQTPAPTPSLVSATPKKELFAMATSTEMTDKMTAVFKDAQEKAKAALEKSQAAFGDVGEFAKGNVEAMVESTKILASGLQEMTKGYVAESKTALEAMTADVKDLTTVKSPTEFFEKQSALLRKNFDAAVAASSKNSEAMMKLASEAFQPISTRVSLAVEKVKHVA